MNPANSAQALASLQQTQAASQDPNTILANQQQQLGVNNAQQTVTGLRGAINNTTKLLQQVAPSVMGRTANSLVTNAQATKQIGNEQAPIQQNLTQEGTDYNQANEDLGQLQTQAQTAASGIYQGQQDKLSYAQNLYNSLYQQEQDAATQAEAKREFDIDQANKLKESSSSGGSDSGLSDAIGAFLAGQSGGNSSQPAKTQQDAYNALKGLLATKNKSTINNTIAAISSAASKGSAYDKMKLQLIQNELSPSFSPYLVSSGKY